MRYILILFLFVFALYGSEYKLKYWEDGLTFGGYLNRYKIDATNFYKKIAPDDLRFLSAIVSNSPYFERVENGKLQETLIPLGDEMQIYVYRSGKEYNFDIVPIEYKVVNDTVAIDIQSGCYSDLKKRVNNPHLATYLKKAFKNSLDFTKLQKGDKIVIKYSQKSINGIAWGEPTILAAFVRHKNSDYFAIKSGNRYKIFCNGLNSTKKSLKKSVKLVKKSRSITFGQPLSRMSISSKFTYKRWHPILHRYRPHLGVDLRGKIGTPIYAVASGKVVYAGWMRGYGKVVKINHGNGYISLYAHQSRIYTKVGAKVKKGQKIGAIGTTGRSTGPHLHFGIYKKGRPINPMGVVNRAIKRDYIVKKVVINSKNISSKLTKREKSVYNALKDSTSKEPYVWKDFDKPIDITINKNNIIKSENKSDNRVKLRSKQGVA